MATSDQSNNIPTVQSNDTEQQYNKLLLEADRELSRYIMREKSDEINPFGAERTDPHYKKEPAENATKMLEKIYNSKHSKANNFNDVCAELIMYIKLQEYKKPEEKSMAAGAGITAAQTIFGTLGKLLAGIFRPIIKIFSKKTSTKDNTIQGKPIANKDAAIAALSDLLPLLKIMRDSKETREAFTKDPSILLHILHPGALHVLVGSGIAALASKAVDSAITTKISEKASRLIDYVLEGKDGQTFTAFENEHQNSNTNRVLESLINREDVGNKFKKAVNARLGNSPLKFKEPTAEEYKKNISLYLNAFKRKATIANLEKINLEKIIPVAPIKIANTPTKLESLSVNTQACKKQASNIQRKRNEVPQEVQIKTSGIKR